MRRAADVPLGRHLLQLAHDFAREATDVDLLLGGTVERCATEGQAGESADDRRRVVNIPTEDTRQACARFGIAAVSFKCLGRELQDVQRISQFVAEHSIEKFKAICFAAES